MYSIENNLLEKLDDYPQSPLRYPGSKRKAIKHILSLIPAEIETLVSPFMGGGAVELAVASIRRVYAYDLFDFVVCFWKEVLDNPEPMMQVALSEIPMTRDRFYEIQKMDYDTKPQFVKAMAFYLLNKTSFSGATFSGGCSSLTLKILNESSIQRLGKCKLPNLTVDKLSFQESIPLHSNDFLYLDPPYINRNQNLYGKKGDAHKNFPHVELATMLNSRDKWVLSYNDCPEVRELYKDRRILVTNWKHKMSKIEYDELLILSDDIRDVRE